MVGEMNGVEGAVDKVDDGKEVERAVIDDEQRWVVTVAGGEETTDAIEGMCDGAEGRSGTAEIFPSHVHNNHNSRESNL